MPKVGLTNLTDKALNKLPNNTNLRLVLFVVGGIVVCASGLIYVLPIADEVHQNLSGAKLLKEQYQRTLNETQQKIEEVSRILASF